MNYYTYEKFMTPERDNYLMDLENEILSKYGWHFTNLKKDRINNVEWMNLIKRFMDTGVYENEAQQQQFINYYKQWVLLGGGDEWFK